MEKNQYDLCVKVIKKLKKAGALKIPLISQKTDQRPLRGTFLISAML